MKQTPITYRCNQCHEDLHKSAFHVRKSGGSSGKMRQPCKECEADNCRRWREANPEKMSAIKRNWCVNNRGIERAGRRRTYHSNKQAAREHSRKWALNNPDRIRTMDRAGATLLRAIKAGLVVRPAMCAKCHNGGIIEASHTDYSKPLDVIWLCQPCHRQEDSARPKTRTPTS